MTDEGAGVEALEVEVEAIAEDERWGSALGGPEAVEALARRAVAAALAADGTTMPGEAVALSLLLADDETLRGLNRAWRGQDKATNVLSFPAPPPPGGRAGPEGGPRHLGDVALAYETVVREAEDEGKSLAHHLAHLVVHGTLHLLGHDHEAEDEAEAMEAAEVRALARIGVADPYRGAAAEDVGSA